MIMLGAVLLLATLAFVQPTPPPQQQGATEIDEVVVQGRRATSDFVRNTSAPTERNRLARWRHEICPGVVGLPAQQGAYLTERIAQEGRRLGLEIGAPGCRADVMVVFTDQPDLAAETISRKNRAYFAEVERRGSPESGGGGQSLRSFIGADLPVRWWHVSRLTGSDGREVGFAERSRGAQGGGGAPGGGVLIPVVDTTSQSSRTGSNFREDLTRALVIVDAARVKGVTYEALGGYVAMVSLAQLNPEARLGGVATILSLFQDREAGIAPPEGLTDWDRAYLKGLYEAPDNARNLNTQRGAIRRELRKVSEPGR